MILSHSPFLLSDKSGVNNFFFFSGKDIFWYFYKRENKCENIFDDIQIIKHDYNRTKLRAEANCLKQVYFFLDIFWAHFSTAAQNPA